MQFDIIIIGGGMVGVTLACALQKSDLRIALIDSAPIDSGEDERLIALNDSSICLYENIGIWPSLEPYAAAIRQVHVSHKGRFGITRINAADLGLAALGYVVPAKYINSALLDHLHAIDSVKLFQPAILESLEQDAEGVTLRINTANGAQSLRAKSVIGADGSFSTVRKLLAIPVEKIDYQQSALVTVTELQRDHQHIAYERFQNSGAIAMLPLADQRVATIWTDRNETIADLMSLSDTAFLSQLQKQFGYRLGRLHNVGKRAVYPLQMLRAQEQRKQHVMLIGNALHTMHPIAAQGLNVALHEVAVLVERIVIRDVPAGGCPGMLLGAAGPPRDNDFNIQLSDRLTWIFSTDLFVLNKARQLAMLGLDIFRPARKYFTQRAMGRRGEVPYLLIRKDG